MSPASCASSTQAQHPPDLGAGSEAELPHQVIAGDERCPWRRRAHRAVAVEHVTHVHNVAAVVACVKPRAARRHVVGDAECEQRDRGVAQIAEEPRHRPIGRGAAVAHLRGAEVVQHERPHERDLAIAEAQPSQNRLGLGRALLRVTEEADASGRVGSLRLRLGDVVQQRRELRERAATVPGRDLLVEVGVHIHELIEPAPVLETRPQERAPGGRDGRNERLDGGNRFEIVLEHVVVVLRRLRHAPAGRQLGQQMLEHAHLLEGADAARRVVRREDAHQLVVRALGRGVEHPAGVAAGLREQRRCEREAELDAEPGRPHQPGAVVAKAAAGDETEDARGDIGAAAVDIGEVARTSAADADRDRIDGEVALPEVGFDGAAPQRRDIERRAAGQHHARDTARLIEQHERTTELHRQPPPGHERVALDDDVEVAGVAAERQIANEPAHCPRAHAAARERPHDSIGPAHLREAGPELRDQRVVSDSRHRIPIGRGATPRRRPGRRAPASSTDRGS